MITFSASVPAILDVAQMFEDVEITFGSERVLSQELAALEQASSATGYRFTDALADQKAFIERLVRPALSAHGEQLLERVHAGTLRFRLLRQVPSHAKLYLMAGESGFRVVTGSANLSFAALTGRQRETFFVSDAEADHRRFMAYYTQNEERSDPVAADLLVVSSDRPDQPRLAVPDNALDVEKVPCFRFLRAQGAIVETPQATRHAGALRRGHAARERAWHGAAASSRSTATGAVPRWSPPRASPGPGEPTARGRSPTRPTGSRPPGSTSRRA